MLSAVLLLVAVAELTLVALLRDARPRAALVAVVGVGLAYDSAVVGLGAMLGEGEALRVLSVGRYAGHAVLTPLLVVWAGALSSRPGVRAAAVATAVLLIGWGAAVDLGGLSLVPGTFGGTLRYVPAESGGPPVPALLVVVVLLVTGALVRRRTRRPWLLAGAVVMVVASAVAVAAPPLGNVGELALLAAIVLTERDLAGHGRRGISGATRPRHDPRRP